MMKKYAALIANIGINANSKQDVVIKAPVETYAFVRYLVMELYSAKARNVYVDWYDSSTTRQTLLHVAPSRLSEVPQWEIEREKERFENNVARISLVGEDPKVFKLVKPERLSKYNKARVEAFHHIKRITIIMIQLGVLLLFQQKSGHKLYFLTNHLHKQLANYGMQYIRHVE